MDSKWIILLVGVIIILGLVLFYLFRNQKPEGFANLKVGNKTIEVELADTPEKRSQGLSGREKLEKNQGMLFVFERSNYHSFWMKDMKFNLDFIYIREGRVVDLKEDVASPAPDQPDSQLEVFLPKVVVEQVLEVNAGFVKKYNIKIGDKVEVY